MLFNNYQTKKISGMQEEKQDKNKYVGLWLGIKHFVMSQLVKCKILKMFMENYFPSINICLFNCMACY